MLDPVDVSLELSSLSVDSPRFAVAEDLVVSDAAAICPVLSLTETAAIWRREPDSFSEALFLLETPPFAEETFV